VQSHINENIIHGDTYRGHRINNGIDSRHTCYKQSLDKIIDEIKEKTIKHSKTHVTRLDIHPPVDMDTKKQSEAMTRVVESTLRELSRRHRSSAHDPDISVLRTTEVGHNQNNQHFHLTIVSNGNAIQNGYTFLESIRRHSDRIFKTSMSGRVNYSSSNNGTGIMINRNSPNFEEKMNQAIYAASYLAKTNTKENLRKGTHKLSISRSFNK